MSKAEPDVQSPSTISPAAAESQGGITRQYSLSSTRSARQRWQFNPLYGYSIEQIRAA